MPAFWTSFFSFKFISLSQKKKCFLLLFIGLVNSKVRSISWVIFPYRDNMYTVIIRDVKFASGIKNNKKICLPIHRCVLALLTQYFPESCEKISQACYSSGIRTHDPCNSRAVSYQLDYRGCPVARGSLNPLFYSEYHNDSASKNIHVCWDLFFQAFWLLLYINTLTANCFMRTAGHI